MAATETKQGTAPGTPEASAAPAVPPVTQATTGSPPPGAAPPVAPVVSEEAASIVAAKINAMASKINAARELARRLSEEKQAAAGKNGVSLRHSPFIRTLPQS